MSIPSDKLAPLPSGSSNRTLDEAEFAPSSGAATYSSMADRDRFASRPRTEARGPNDPFGAAAEVYAHCYGLTPTEQSILEACLRGEPDRAIAGERGCSLSTVQTHWQRIAHKTGVSDRRRLVAAVWGSFWRAMEAYADAAGTEPA